MNHQDDLELNYKAKSNEQPPPEVDRLIIQAATDALNSKSSNVGLGRFNFRSWQMPVSIAAAALFTFSFINTYDLWKSEAELDLVGNVASPQSADFDKDQHLEIVSSPAISAKESKSDQRLNRLEVSKKPKAVSTSSSLDETIVVTGSRITVLSVPSRTRLPVTEAAIEENEQASQLIQKSRKLSVEKWFEKIEANIAINKIEIAKADIVILLQQHPLQSFSKQQHQRFVIINKKILVK